LLLLFFMAVGLGLTSCSGEESGGDDGDGLAGSRFSVSVFDGGFSSTEKDMQTRASESGLSTIFTAGDQIGVFAVKDGAIRTEVNNLCLTAAMDGSQLAWKDAGGNAPLKINGAVYYAYYPYRSTLPGAPDASATNAAAFFAGIIANWIPATDQGTYAQYTAQDLMTATSSISSGGLSFSMQHKMALVAIELPVVASISQFNNYTPYKVTDGIYRYLVNPASLPAPAGTYTTTSGAARNWKINLAGISTGSYRLYRVDCVERHPAKAGVYAEFWSAHFGDAGRWMTTNLSATAYDGLTHSAGRTLTGPNASPQIGGVNQYSTAYWCYPNGGLGGSNSTSYAANPHLGLLYTWDAATAGKGGINGQGNPTDEGNMAETTTNESGKQQRIQGVCPQGWHLPSDREWNELEKYIYEHAEDYSSYTPTERQNFPNSGAWLSAWHTTSNWRPTGTVTQAHGAAMMSAPNGRSHSVAQNGFEAQLSGFASSGSASGYGSFGYWWSASSYTSNRAWDRYVGSGNSQVLRNDYSRYALFSVRCKKD
jgi:uncharacterized protein (TIGR02145 family)